MKFPALTEMVEYLMDDNGVYQDTNRAVAIADKFGNYVAEDEAKIALKSPDDNNILSDAYILVYGEQSQADAIRHRYYALDGFLDQAWSEV